MSQPIIQVQGISKKYMISHKAKHDTLRDRVMSFFRRDTEVWDTTEEFWALRDISFEVKQGEAVGIIGRNGAGKSTLLKVLSRIVAPTTGEVRLRGRVASLLEVGTGFHPELTGRENIYLNGAILGMSRKEIDRKFDEIIDFSGVEKFLDTPVKRYSSGMYVRLAFAVAAHLEPEILIVDEVLAVGDAEFQKKCLGKMQSVSAKEGRTVIFVSHSMTAISSICNRVILLERGATQFIGNVKQGVEFYLGAGAASQGVSLEDRPRSGPGKFGRYTSVELFNDDNEPTQQFRIGGELRIRLGFRLSEPIANLELGFAFTDQLTYPLMGFVNTWEGGLTNFPAGEHLIQVTVPNIPLLPGRFNIIIWLKRRGEGVDDEVDMAVQFEVIGYDVTGFNPYFETYRHLGIFQRSTWKVLSETLETC